MNEITAVLVDGKWYIVKSISVNSKGVKFFDISNCESAKVWISQRRVTAYQYF